MQKVNTTQYAELLQHHWKIKSPLFVAGGPGIGKSMIPLQVFKTLAEEKGLEFIRWDRTNKDEKDAMFADPSKYFVFCDQRLSQMDTTDLRGIPKMESDMVDFMPPAWVSYFCNEKANGVIFFDEINLAPPVVAGAAYQIIHDRSMSDMKLSDNVMLIAAGNRAEDKAFTFDMPLPLRDRFSECELQPSVETWTEWAAGNVNPHLVSFVNWKESYLYRISDTGQDKSTTPRGIKRASDLIGKLSVTDSKIPLLTSIACGEAFATEFQAYVKYFADLDWDKIYSEPECLEDMEISQLFAVCGGLSEHFQKEPRQEKFDSIVGIVDKMKPEFAVMTLRMMRDFDVKTFKRLGIKNKVFVNTIAPRLGKFII
tara:strand:+ start:2162 stop:3268 length:1107 start_codon:yes stop_codon:yes gene_type:complete